MDLLTKLSDNSLLGTLLAISLLALGWSVRMLLLEKDKRIAAAEKVRDDITAPLGFIKDSLALIQAKVEISKERGNNVE